MQIDLRMVNSKRNESNDKNAKEWSAVSLRDKLFYDVTHAKNGTSAKGERGWKVTHCRTETSFPFD